MKNYLKITNVSDLNNITISSYRTNKTDIEIAILRLLEDSSIVITDLQIDSENSNTNGKVFLLSIEYNEKNNDDNKFRVLVNLFDFNDKFIQDITSKL